MIACKHSYIMEWETFNAMNKSEIYETYKKWNADGYTVYVHVVVNGIDKGYWILDSKCELTLTNFNPKW